MQQLSITGDDWKSDRAKAAEARASRKRDEAGRACAKALNAASKALGAYLQACRDCNDGSGDEFGELMVALGADADQVTALVSAVDALRFSGGFNLEQTRDSLCDIHVFGYGAHHLMGIDADRDMTAVVDGVMTRFVKSEGDRQATIAKHAAKGVTDVYFVGEFPTMVMKSARDQPDAPKGKFMKSASYTEPTFYAA